MKNIGSARLHTLPQSLILRTILHVPTIAVSLLLVKKLCKDNFCWFICDDNKFFVQEKVTKVVLYHGMTNEGELFRIPVKLLLESPSQKSVALLG